MKYKFKGSDIKRIIAEEVTRYYSLNEGFPSFIKPASLSSTTDAPSATTEPSQQQSTSNKSDPASAPMRFSVVIQSKGAAAPATVINASNIEDAVETATHWMKKGRTIDQTKTSKEVLQQLNMEPTMSDEPGVPDAQTSQQEPKLSGIMEDEQLPVEETKLVRPKREEFLKQTYELVKQQMPGLSFEDFMKIEPPGGLSGRVNVMHYYYNTNDMPDKVAKILLGHMQKEEEMS